MSKTAFEKRGRAFEEEYFNKENLKLVDKLKALFQRKRNREEIQQETGISDEEVLDNLVELNVSGELLAAFQLLPILEVAWADGEVDEREAKAVLLAAEQHGLLPGSSAYRMLEGGLQVRPRPDARAAWFAYAAELRKALSPAELDSFRKDLLEVCHTVAVISGGLLNIAFTISPNEKVVMEKIEKALTHEAS